MSISIYKAFLLAILLLSCSNYQTRENICDNTGESNDLLIDSLVIISTQEYVDLTDYGFDDSLKSEMTRKMCQYRVEEGLIKDTILFRAIYPFIKSLYANGNCSVLLDFYSPSWQRITNGPLSHYDSFLIWMQLKSLTAIIDSADDWAVVRYNSCYIMVPKGLSNTLYTPIGTMTVFFDEKMRYSLPGSKSDILEYRDGKIMEPNRRTKLRFTE